MKTYTYRGSMYYISFFIPSILMLGVFGWVLYEMWQHGLLAPYNLIAVVMSIVLLSTFVGLNNPTLVQLSQSSIIFKSFGLKHEYKWKEIDELSVKSFHFVGKTLIRIGKQRLFGGRYWVNSHMDGYDELVRILAEKAERIEKKKAKKPYKGGRK